MTLAEYIKQFGDLDAAKLFGVKERTAASWRRGERRPRPEVAASIVAATGGEVTLDGIYGPHDLDAA